MSDLHGIVEDVQIALEDEIKTFVVKCLEK